MTSYVISYRTGGNEALRAPIWSRKAVSPPEAREEVRAEFELKNTSPTDAPSVLGPTIQLQTGKDEPGRYKMEVG
ncbi:hypothetical protein CVT26_015550 [Gymnopilus dilepis]|uniref:Uncharacterized protein n=1 Tax=Gymnopilus dilepis TaxID=231916 RepID=A0A409YD84_9AGAR|nr:hypothetical protein CVT26_015550 [Gymnopilus dilepis]